MAFEGVNGNFNLPKIKCKIDAEIFLALLVLPRYTTGYKVLFIISLYTATLRYYVINYVINK